MYSLWHQYASLTRTRELLYYPFVPFFTVFSHVISSPKHNTCASNLALLRNMEGFLKRMDRNHQQARKLHGIAKTFLLLAEKYVAGTSTRSAMTQSQPLSSSGDKQKEFYTSHHPQSATMGAGTLASLSQLLALPTMYQPSPHTYPTVLNPTPTAITYPSDPALLKHWLPPNPTLRDFQDTIMSDFPSGSFGSARGEGTDIWDWPMGGSFDWFSWDQWESCKRDLRIQ